jgi:membrane protein DedA with SNARE-associated domain
MLSDLVQTFATFMGQIVTTFGAPGIALVALFENLFPPTPSEFLYPLAGKLAYDGKISIVAIIFAGVLGSLLGSMLYYGFGYRLGEERARELIARHGTLRIFRLSMPVISVAEFDRGLALFERHGGGIVFVARVLPLVHGVISIPAGVVRMNLPLFLLYTALGAALWIAPLTIFGYWLGNNWQRVLNWVDVYQNIVYALFIAMIVVYIVRRVRRMKANPGV